MAETKGMPAAKSLDYDLTRQPSSAMEDGPMSQGLTERGPR